MRKTLLFYAAYYFFLFCPSCAEATVLTPERTVIAGEVVNLTDDIRALQVNYCDPLDTDDVRYSENLVETGGRFHTAHDYAFAQNLTLRVGDRFINLFVNPGDSVFVTIDAAKLAGGQEGAVIFSADNAVINEQLYGWTNYAYRQPVPEFDGNADEKDFIASLKEAFRQTEERIEEYDREFSLSDFMKDWAYTDYKFVIANQIMGYGNAESKWRVFTDPAFDVFNERNFRSMYFPYHLGACVGALVQGDEQIAAMFEEGKTTPGFRALIAKLAKAAPKGLARDMMMYQTMVQYLDEEPYLYDSLPELKTFFSDPIFDRRLSDFADRKINLRASVTIEGSPTEGISYLDGGKVVPLPETDLLVHLRELYPDKVLYIDVWATWCGPCLEEMGSAGALHERFGNEGGVVFINLCLNSSPEQWTERIIEYKIEGENYFLDREASNLFMGQYNLPGFPSYLIIDRAGELSPAPRPSDTDKAEQAIRQGLDVMTLH